MLGGNVVVAMVAQDLSFVDSFYLMVVTVTPVGYGDIVVEYTQSVWHLIAKLSFNFNYNLVES